MILGFVAVHPLINFIAILGIVLSPKILPQKNLIIFSPFNVRKIGPKKLCSCGRKTEPVMEVHAGEWDGIEFYTCCYHE